MGVGKGGQRGHALLDFKNFSKKDCFLSFEWEKKKFHHFWPTPEKKFKSTSGPFLEKNPSDAHELLHKHLTA